MLRPSERLTAMGLMLPVLRAPVGLFAPARLHGDLLYISGQGPVTATGAMIGKVGDTVTAEAAADHARLVTLNLLAVAQQALGSIDRIAGIVKVLGFVNAAPDFTRHPFVIDGCSRLLSELFEESAPAHARSAIGVGSLPGNITVEIEMIAQVICE